MVLRPQAFKVLECLVQKAPGIVSREELLETVWGHNALSVSGISQAIREIRRTLGDDASEPAILATRHGRGYQVIVEVSLESAAQSTNPEPDQGLDEFQPGSSRKPISPVLSLSVLVIIGLTITSSWLGLREMLISDQRSHSAADRAFAERSLPRHPEAFSLFLNGQVFASQRAWPRAFESLQQALELEPGSLSVRLALIKAYMQAGFDHKAASLAEHSLIRQKSFSRREELELAALRARLAGRWPEALRSLDSLSVFFADDLEYLYDLIDLQLGIRPASEARQTLDRLRALLAVESPGVRYWLTASKVHRRMGHWSEASVAAEFAIKAAGTEDLAAMRAHAFLARAESLLAMGESSAGREMLRRAVAGMRSVHDPRGHADALVVMAELDERQGRDEEAARWMEQSCTIYRGLQHRAGLAKCDYLNGQARLVDDDHLIASRLFENSAQQFIEAGTLSQAAAAWLGLSDVQLQAGNICEAQASHRSAERLVHQIGDRQGLAMSQIALGKLLVHQQQAVPARKAFEQALMVFDALGDRRGQAVASARLASVLEAGGEFEAAVTLNERAIALYRQLGNHRQLAGALYEAALSSQRRGHLRQALDRLVEASSIFEAQRAVDPLAAALIAIARIEIERADAAAAATAIERVSAFELQDPLRIASLETAAGELALLEWRLDEAQRRFRTARTLRADAGFQSGVLSSDLDLARLAIEQQEAGKAEALARGVLEAYDRSAPVEDRAAAVLILASSLVEQGRLAEAREQLAIARSLQFEEHDNRLNLEFQMLNSMARAVDDIRAHLASVRDRAREKDYHLIAMEAEMALAEYMLDSGDRSSAFELVSTVRSSAHAAGVFCVVERADRLRVPINAP
ncbi:MAG: winged helix-turn-helix domain-containing protein [Wenzhouxiangellaceae bacterium]|nr:winged helix-turn-helix domain-containing protein [Wenzhouxiangellaceae bacterium]